MAVCVFYAAIFVIILFHEHLSKTSIQLISLVTIAVAIMAVVNYYIEYVKAKGKKITDLDACVEKKESI